MRSATKAPSHADDKQRGPVCGCLGVPLLVFAAFGDPVEESLHAGAFAPDKTDELGCAEVGGVFAKEGFEAPLKIGRRPGTEPITFGRDPVVAEGVEHGLRQSTTRGAMCCASPQTCGARHLLD
jgi:hypothetical protein